MIVTRSKLEAAYKKLVLADIKRGIPDFNENIYLEIVKIVKHIYFQVTPDIIKAKLYCFYFEEGLEKLNLEIHNNFDFIFLLWRVARSHSRYNCNL